MTLYTVNDFKKKFRAALIDIYVVDEIDSIFYIAAEEALGIVRMDLLRNPEKPIGLESHQKLDIILKQLQEKEPIQYILGKTVFYNSDFLVNPSVLIPRQETELLVDSIIKHPFSKKAKAILDIGTGSGCIAISLKKNLNHAQIFALDISLDALEVAKQNATRNSTDITFIQADILSENAKLTERFDIIVSNPPYVRESEKQYMHENVLSFEPHLALFIEDSNPLLFYKSIIKFSNVHLVSQGILALEINEAFGNEVKNILIENSFIQIEIIKDFSEKDRIIIAQKQ